MLENTTDKERTKAARKAGIFQDRKSHYTMAGHVFLKGEDCGRLRQRVFVLNRMRGGKCDICGKELQYSEGDLEHINGGRKNARCWCFVQTLNDGTVCTNVRRTCSMFAPNSCHARKHKRYLSFSKKQLVVCWKHPKLVIFDGFTCPACRAESELDSGQMSA